MSNTDNPQPTNTFAVAGNLTRDPQLSYSGSGTPYVKFGLAENKRRKEGDRWVDDTPVFWNVTAFGDQAEHVAETLRRGDRVAVIGRREPAREYDRADGTKGVADHDVIADEVGPSLRYTTALVNRIEHQLQARTATDGVGI